MLLVQVDLQLVHEFAVVVAELTLVGLQLLVFLDVLLQVQLAGTGKGAFVTAEDHAFQMTRQLRARHLQWDHALLWEPWKQHNHTRIHITLSFWSVALNDQHYLHIFNHLWTWSTKAVISSTGIFVAIANNTLYVKIIHFYFMAKIIRILRSCSI